MSRFSPDSLPLSEDEIAAARVRADAVRVEAVRAAREYALKGDEAAALEVHRAWKPVSSKR